jgi:hypothetical protein
MSLALNCTCYHNKEIRILCFLGDTLSRASHTESRDRVRIPAPPTKDIIRGSNCPFTKQGYVLQTNPTAAGRFLVASDFTGLPLIFPQRTGVVQN